MLLVTYKLSKYTKQKAIFMRETLKQFLAVVGSALVNAAQELNNNQDDSYDQNDCDDTTNIDCQSEPDKDPYGLNSFNNSTKAVEFEEIDQPSTKAKQNGEDGEYDEQNGEQDFNDEDLDGENQFDDFDDQNDEFDDKEDKSDIDRQGNVKYVQDAHLVTRHQVEDGTYEELWIFNNDRNNHRRSDKIISDIIKDTDIPENEISSEDGSQNYIIWSVGNIQMVKVTGLPE